MYRAALITLVVCFFSFTAILPAQEKEKEKKKDPLDELIAGKSIGAWIKILRTHDNPKYRRAALIAIEAGDAAGRTALPALFDAIEKDKEPQVRQAAVMLLGRLGPKTNGALKALVAALQTDKSDEVREAAATAIGSKFTEQASDYLSALTDALKDPYAGTRIAAASALRNMGENARPAIPLLMASAKNPKEPLLVRAAALHVISRVGKDDPQTVPLLLDLLKNSETPPALREAAADGLGRSGSDLSEVVTALGKVLGDKNLDLRKSAAVALGALGSKSKTAWPAIKERLSDAKEDSSVRNHLIRLTGVLGKTTSEAVKVLVDAAVNDKSTENRVAAIQELGELGALPKEARDALRVIAAKDARAIIREAAAKALKQVGG